MNVSFEHAGRQVTFCDCDPRDCIEGELLRGSWYELANLELIRSLNVEGNYLDVGAYVGTHSIFFSLFCPADHVYAVEAQGDICRKLQNNIAANQIDNCTTYHHGIADKSGTAQLAVPNRIYANRGGARLETGDVLDDLGDIPVVTLDSFGFQNIRLAKIDVEGGELKVLGGGERTLSNVEHLFVELWPEDVCHRYGVEYTGGKVSLLLKDWGLLCQKQLQSDLFWFARV